MSDNYKESRSTSGKRWQNEPEMNVEVRNGVRKKRFSTGIQVIADPFTLKPPPSILKHNSKTSDTTCFSTLDFFYSLNISKPVSNPNKNGNKERSHLLKIRNDNENIINCKIPKSYMYFTEDDRKFVILINYPCTLKFQGRMKMSLIVGALECSGFVMNAKSKVQTIDVFSPKFFTSQVIDVKSFNQPVHDVRKILKNKLDGLIQAKDVKQLLDIYSENDAVVVVEPIFCNFINVLEKYFYKTLFPFQKNLQTYLPEVSQALESTLLFGSEELNELKKNSDWDEIPLDKCTVVCGGKGVGKSTLLKYFINVTLRSNESVLYLDFDPGQPEFTPAGYISATLIKKPITGPNFTHVTTPERMVYLGEVNVAQCPSMYLECVEHIINFCHQHSTLSKMQWFVNTMGFCKGLGVSLMISILKMLKPSVVIQLRSPKKSKNYPFDLSVETVNSTKGFSGTIQKEGKVSYNFYCIESCTDADGISSQGGLKPKEIREVMTLSYFSQMTAGPYFNFNAVVPYSVSFSHLYLALNSSVSPFDVLKAFNGNMVALCRFDQHSFNGKVLRSDEPNNFKIVFQPEVMPSYGLGLVRGVDVESKLFYIISPVPYDTLQMVNCLMLGTINPPASMFINQVNVDGPCLYTSINKGDHIKGIKRMFQTHKHTTFKELNDSFYN